MPHATRSFARPLFLFFSLVLLFSIASATPPSEEKVASVRRWTDEHAGELVKHYQYLHTHPELSLQERETAAYLAKLWRDAGLEVTEKVGGHGIVGILENGKGPTVMLRTDMDALPVTEATDLPYASRVQTKTPKESAPESCTPALMISI